MFQFAGVSVSIKKCPTQAQCMAVDISVPATPKPVGVTNYRSDYRLCAVATPYYDASDFYEGSAVPPVPTNELMQMDEAAGVKRNIGYRVRRVFSFRPARCYRVMNGDNCNTLEDIPPAGSNIDYWLRRCNNNVTNVNSFLTPDNFYVSGDGLPYPSAVKELHDNNARLYYEQTCNYCIYVNWYFACLARNIL
jgi:hypothetical protein